MVFSDEGASTGDVRVAVGSEAGTDSPKRFRFGVRVVSDLYDVVDEVELSDTAHVVVLDDEVEEAVDETVVVVLADEALD